MPKNPELPAVVLQVPLALGFGVAMVLVGFRVDETHPGFHAGLQMEPAGHVFDEIRPAR